MLFSTNRTKTRTAQKHEPYTNIFWHERFLRVWNVSLYEWSFTDLLFWSNIILKDYELFVKRWYITHTKSTLDRTTHKINTELIESICTLLALISTFSVCLNEIVKEFTCWYENPRVVASIRHNSTFNLYTSTKYSHVEQTPHTKHLLIIVVAKTRCTSVLKSC